MNDREIETFFFFLGRVVFGLTDALNCYFNISAQLFYWIGVGQQTCLLECTQRNAVNLTLGYVLITVGFSRIGP